MPTTLAEPKLSYEEERGKPMPSDNHGAVQASLIVELARHAAYRVYSELTLDVGGVSMTPDISLYPRQGLDLRRDVLRRPDPPLLTVEIFSPRQGMQEVMDKVDAYFRHGVRSCWVIAPPLRDLTIFTTDGGELHFHGGRATDPILGVTVDVDAVFA